MFRHKTSPVEQKEEKKDALTEEKSEAKTAQIKTVKDATPEALRDLLEKNLKWSQIIYEQNRRINRKMFWYAFAGWLRLLIIVVPLALAVVFLPPFIRQAWEQYQGLVGQVSSTPGGISPNSLEKLLKLLPLNSVQQEQLNTMLK